tara:strand:- start:184 stop:1371 length:1188 start_codon:yes stop_codon:yes gene_type:complete
MVVVNNKGNITGILNQEVFSNVDYINKRKDIVIKEIMKKRPLTISPSSNIAHALEIMNHKKVGFLPVVEDKLFIGIVQKKKLTQYEINTNNKTNTNLINQFERVIGNYHSNNDKTIIFIGALHGNENSGVLALEKFFQELKNSNINLTGTVIGLIGNINALKNNQRYIEEDMNRMWTNKKIKSSSNRNNIDRQEMLLLKDLIDKIITLKKKKNITIIDLHNTSSPNGVFTIVNNKKEKNLAAFLNIPTINNLLNRVKGSLAEYYSAENVNSIVFEGGSIGDPASINNHEVGIWKMLEKRGFIDEKNIPQRIKNNNKIMVEFSKKTKGNYFVKYIHKIKKEDDFIMYPNMRNFEKIKKGQIIAKNNNLEVASPIDGYLLMPLYQKIGNEGFYIICK